MQSTVPLKLKMSPVDTPHLAAFLQSWPGRIVLTISATALVAACAHVSLAIPFTPVPLTLSDFAVIVVGMVLGPVAGFSAMVLYLAEGAAGLPVFNPIGLGGLAQLMGPTAGYLFAYPLAAAVAGLARTFAKGNMSAFTAGVVAGCAATAIILGSGAGWLAHLRYLGPSAVWAVAVAPFLFGAGAKIVAAALIFGSTRRWFRSPDSGR